MGMDGVLLAAIITKHQETTEKDVTIQLLNLKEARAMTQQQPASTMSSASISRATKLQGGPAKVRPTYIFDGNI